MLGLHSFCDGSLCGTSASCLPGAQSLHDAEVDLANCDGTYLHHRVYCVDLLDALFWLSCLLLEAEIMVADSDLDLISGEVLLISPNFGRADY